MGKEIEYFKVSIERVINTQDKIFDEIKQMRQDYSNQRVACENRFTKIESDSKINSAIRGSIFGGVAAIATFAGKWVFDKIVGS